jgi:hypothetical protein
VNAQFGVNRKQQEVVVEDQQPPLELDDPGLLMAMEMFSKMSPEEVEETMMQLKEMLGDDPETMAAIDDVIKEIPNMKAAGIQSSLKDMISDDEIQAATNDALRLLRSTENVWETIWEQRDAILEAVIASGQITPMDATRFRNDRNEWEAELKHIWNELQKEAATLEKSQQ